MSLISDLRKTADRILNSTTSNLGSRQKSIDLVVQTWSENAENSTGHIIYTEIIPIKVGYDQTTDGYLYNPGIEILSTQNKGSYNLRDRYVDSDGTKPNALYKVGPLTPGFFDEIILNPIQNDAKKSYKFRITDGSKSFLLNKIGMDKKGILEQTYLILEVL
jgi:hypothetical protein